MKDFLNELNQNADELHAMRAVRRLILADLKSNLTAKEKEEVMKFQTLLNQATAVVKSNANNGCVIAVLSELEQDFRPCMEVMEEAVKRDFEAEGL